MSDIFREVDEEVKKDQAMKLWQAYGKYVIGAAVAVVLLTAANVGWKEYSKRQGEAQGERFASAQALLAKGTYADAATAFASLSAEGSGGYRALAGLQEGAALLRAGDKAGAIAAFDRISASADDKTLADLARLFAALHSVDQASEGDVMARLNPLLDPANSWYHSAREVAAMVALQAGRREDALKAFGELADGEDVPSGIRRRASEMRAALGGAQ